MASTPLLLLTGLRCSGKTTLGAAVAADCRVTFTDLDPLVLAELGASSVGQAFERFGETGWRQGEAAVLRRAIEGDLSGVLSMGGGTPIAPGAAATIRRAQATGRARVALLDPGSGELIARIARGRGDRPRLATNDRAEVERLSAERLPLYRSIADVVIDTRAPERDCVTRLAALLNSPRWPWPSSRASG